MWVLVGAIAIVAAGATVGATLLTRTDTGGASTAAHRVWRAWAGSSPRV